MDHKAEAALRAEHATVMDLEDAWFMNCDHYADDHPERKRLLGVYNEVRPEVIAREQAEIRRLKTLRLARAM